MLDNASLTSALVHVQRRGHVKALGWACWIVWLFAMPCYAQQPMRVHEQAQSKIRVVVLTDVANEPDDSESMVRFLLYTNEFDVEALIATTSMWLKDSVHPELIEARVHAYGKVLTNLRQHAEGYPDEQYLLDRIRAGRADYGMQGVGEGKDTVASEHIIAVVDRIDARPVWFSIWGGAVDLAQALWKVQHTRDAAAVAAFVSKLRVYSISDQDDAGPWIRRMFPDVFWIASIHALGDYSQATWTGISGDLMRPMPGADTSLVSHEWVAAHIQQGPLGQLYPSSQYIMEGDSPSFLYLIPNGLGQPEHPDYGSWGGRYGKVDAAQGLYANASDTVLGIDGITYRTAQATIWRWRRAFQNDFAARLQWTLQPSYKDANHNPLVRINNVGGRDPVSITVCPGDIVHLSANGSADPDGDPLSYRWWQYQEASGLFGVPGIKLQHADSADSFFKAPAASAPLHIVLEVQDDGEPAMVSYRRVIVTGHGDAAANKSPKPCAK